MQRSKSRRSQKDGDRVKTLFTTEIHRNSRKKIYKIGIVSNNNKYDGTIFCQIRVLPRQSIVDFYFLLSLDVLYKSTQKNMYNLYMPCAHL